MWMTALRRLCRAATGAWVFASGAACTDDSDPEATAQRAEEKQGQAQADGDGPDAAPPRDCGPAGLCPRDALCVRTRGALCTPLPPEGRSCPADCEPTEHCCNCPAFVCLKPPAADCNGEVTCDCIDDTPALTHCPAQRRECTETRAGVDVLCIQVDFDEDPFAIDAGDAAAARR